jgi:hypothetical protein
MSKITWQDMKEATAKELKTTYKLNDMQLEMQVRRHLDGANLEERRGVYKEVYDKKR